MSNSTRWYEEVLVLNPTSSEEDQKSLFKDMSETLKKFEGEIFKVHTWGSRPLANQGQKKLTRGVYFHTVFSSNPKGIEELRRKLRIKDSVVYFHHESLKKDLSPEKHMEEFNSHLITTTQREKEREVRINKTKERNFGSYSSKRR